MNKQINLIKRAIETDIRDVVDYKKAIVVTGPRQVGKTTLIKNIASALDPNFLYINGDHSDVQKNWNRPFFTDIMRMIGEHKVIVFDEAQRLNDIGLTVKQIVDVQKGIQVFVSGSSALDLANKLNESLTGRKWTYNLYSFSWGELAGHFSFYEAIKKLDEYLMFGSFPEVILARSRKQEVLAELVNSYLYKDVLELSGIRKPDVLKNLTQALAWQVGNEVSLNELSQTAGADKNTVSHYIDMLEKAFIIFRVNPFSRNQRNEITGKRKIYFYDNGIRNRLINNLEPLHNRNDVGALWENFLMSERMKQLSYNHYYGASYFWRTRNDAEIDCVEDIDGKLHAFEFKWNPKAKGKIPQSFINTYAPAETKIITRDNFYEWLEGYPYQK